MHSVYLLFVVTGAGALFAVGFRQCTDALVQFFNRQIRKGLQGPSRRTLSAYASGALTGLLSGAGTPVILPMLGLIDSGRTSPGRASRLVPGIYLSILFPVWFLYLSGFVLGVDSLGLMLLFFAMVLRFFRKPFLHTLEGLLTGLGLSFLGIGLLNGFLQMIPYSSSLSVAVHGFSQSPASGFLMFLAGAVLILLYRAPMTVFVMASSLCFRGWFPLSLCWAMVLGAHAGYPLIGLFTGRSFSFGARRITVVHAMQNSAGWLICVLSSLFYFPAEVPVHRTPLYLALFTSALYLISSIAGILFRPVWMALSERIIPASTSGGTSDDDLHLVPDYIPESLDANLLIIRNGLARMAILDHEMLMIALNTTQDSNIDASASLTMLKRSAMVDTLADRVGKGLIRLVEQACSSDQADTIGRQQTAVQELSKIADSCTKTMSLLERSYQKQYQFHEEAQSELFDFTTQVLDFLKYNSDFLHGDLKSPDWNLAGDMEDGIDKARNKLRKRARRYLEKDPEAHIRGELAFIEVLGHLEHIGDSCLAISRSIFGSCH